MKRGTQVRGVSTNFGNNVPVCQFDSSTVIGYRVDPHMVGVVVSDMAFDNSGNAWVLVMMSGNLLACPIKMLEEITV